ncbi:hypothetical protein BRD17_02620 [Halobacteriales archaeon SW_7_68_16]|nr:MAG: hypothetical protein BRD17_02620 [Halobacteriales archaeon SW_7_68_16]
MAAEITVPELGLQAGTGALIGAFVGFVSKQIAEILALLVGVQLVIFKYLESQGILWVNYEALSGGIVRGSEQGGASATIAESVASTLSLGGGFTVGFLLGWKRG